MAKSPRSRLPELPLSAAFYQRLGEVAARAGHPLDDARALSEAVGAHSARYTRDRGELARGELGASALRARLGFFLPRDLVKPFGPLAELTRAGRLPAGDTLRVLDLGAGVGATSLGLARYLRTIASPGARLRVTAVERDPDALDVMRALCRALDALPAEFVPITLEARPADLRGAHAGTFDLILLGFVLNELFLERPAQERPALRAELLTQLADRLAPAGALIVLEPARRESARELMQTRELLVDAPGGPHVFAPCTHRAPCPMLARERDFCHERLDYALPPRLREVARSAGLRFEGLSYAALVLTRAARFAAPRAARQRIVSDRLVSKGKLELYGCSEAGYQRFTRLDRARSEDNAGFDALRRGDIVTLTETHVRRETNVPRRA